MVSEKQMKCSICDRPLEEAGVKFSYLGSTFALTALRCPVCGNIYIPEELVDGRIS